MEVNYTQEKRLTPQKQDGQCDNYARQKTKLIFLNIGIVCFLVLNFVLIPDSETIVHNSYSYSETKVETENYYSSEPQASTTTQEKRQEAAPTIQESQEEDFAWLSNKRLETSDLLNFNHRELRILRNAIYARHGYRFRSNDLQEYFGQFSWYTPSKTDVRYELSEIENENVKLIQSLE